MSQALPFDRSRQFDRRATYTMRIARGDAFPPARPDERPTAMEVHRRAHAVRWRAFRRVLAALVARARALLVRTGASYLEYRIARETYRALRELDDRTLHDLGYDRSEIESVAVEVASSRTRRPS